MPLDIRSSRDVQPNRDDVAALKHDLAKAVAWRSANLPEASWHDSGAPELLEALRLDILETHRGRPAWDVWDEWVARFRNAGHDPTQLLATPELRRIANAVAELRASADALRSGERQALARILPIVRDAQDTIRREARALLVRLQPK